jgi:hypothetical protein
MSMTLIAIVSLNCGLTTVDLNNYARDLDLPINFTHETDLRTHSGFLPVNVKGYDTGVETYFDEESKILKKLPPNEAIDSSQSGAITFRWGGSLKEGATALYIAYILGKKCQAVLFETQGGEYIPTDMAKEGAEGMLAVE